MTKQPYLSLQHSESVVTVAAAQIYAAYITSNQVTEGEQQKWMQRCVDEAVYLAQCADAAVQSPGEMA